MYLLLTVPRLLLAHLVHPRNLSSSLVDLKCPPPLAARLASSPFIAKHPFLNEANPSFGARGAVWCDGETNSVVRISRYTRTHNKFRYSYSRGTGRAHAWLGLGVRRVRLQLCRRGPRCASRAHAGTPSGSARASCPSRITRRTSWGPCGAKRSSEGGAGRAGRGGTFDKNGRRARRARSRGASGPHGRVGHARRARGCRKGLTRRAPMGSSKCT